MNKESSLDKIVSSVALICVGVCFVVWADKVTEWIAILFGVISLIYACARAIKFFKTNPEKRTTLPLFYIILSATVGILLVSRANFIKEAISFVVGVYIILTCSTQLLGISTARHKSGLLVGSYLWPMLGIFVGILCITGQFIIPDELARLTGVALIIYGIVYLTGFAVFKSATKKAGKTEHLKIEEAVIVKEAHEAEVKEVKHEKNSKKSKK
jgi:uncharacterized membrane protein HdeD (DUF308 family)